MKKPIGPEHERYATWFERRLGPRNLVDEATLLAIADACDDSVRTGTLTPKQLQLVVDGVSHPRVILWSNAADLLKKLSGRSPAAAEAIVTLMKNRKSHVRFAALCSLGTETPVEITDAALRSGLTERSSEVRWKAADRANRLERVNLVPDIMAALAKEPEGKAKRSMELDLRMLRDGHWIRPGSPGWFNVTARMTEGIASRGVSEEELKSKGLDRILVELRYGRPGGGAV